MMCSFTPDNFISKFRNGLKAERLSSGVSRALAHIYNFSSDVAGRVFTKTVETDRHI